MLGLHITPRSKMFCTNSPLSFPQRVMFLQAVIKGGRETELNNLIGKNHSRHWFGEKDDCISALTVVSHTSYSVV